jgi:site-specific recombinase XerD
MGRENRPYMLPPEWEAAIADWMTWMEVGGTPRSTIRLRRGHLRWLASRSVTESPREVTLGLLVKLISDQHWSNEHRRSRRRSLVAFYDWAVENGRSATNPAADLPRVAADKPKPRPCPDQMWNELLMAAGPREQMMVRLAGEVGMRRSEVAVCHLDDLINDGIGWALIVHGKGNRQRVVPITNQFAADIRTYIENGLPRTVRTERLWSCPKCNSPRVISRGRVPAHTRRTENGGRVPVGIETCDRYRCKDCGAQTSVPSSKVVQVPINGYLFPGDDNGHLSPMYVGKLIGGLMPPGWSMHKLRHRFATKGLAATGDLLAVRDALGHASVATTQIYTAITNDRVRRVCEAAATAIAMMLVVCYLVSPSASGPSLIAFDGTAVVADVEDDADKPRHLDLASDCAHRAPSRSTHLGTSLRKGHERRLVFGRDDGPIRPSDAVAHDLQAGHRGLSPLGAPTAHQRPAKLSSSPICSRADRDSSAATKAAARDSAASRAAAWRARLRDSSKASATMALMSSRVRCTAPPRAVRAGEGPTLATSAIGRPWSSSMPRAAKPGVLTASAAISSSP